MSLIVSAGLTESFIFAKPIGVGLIDSAITLTKMIIELNPKKIIFIGSAGSYGKKELFEIFESKTSANIEHSFLNKSAYSPIDNCVSMGKDDSDSKNIVNSSNYITQNRDLSEKFLKLGLKAENMEFYSILKVAARFNIDALGVFVVSNYCYEDAQKEYKKNYKKCNRLLEAYVCEKYLEVL